MQEQRRKTVSAALLPGDNCWKSYFSELARFVVEILQSSSARFWMKLPNLKPFLTTREQKAPFNTTMKMDGTHRARQIGNFLPPNETVMETITKKIERYNQPTFL